MPQQIQNVPHKNHSINFVYNYLLILFYVKGRRILRMHLIKCHTGSPHQTKSNQSHFEAERHRITQKINHETLFSMHIELSNSLCGCACERRIDEAAYVAIQSLFGFANQITIYIKRKDGIKSMILFSFQCSIHIINYIAQASLVRCFVCARVVYYMVMLASGSLHIKV